MAIKRELLEALGKQIRQSHRRGKTILVLILVLLIPYGLYVFLAGLRRGRQMIEYSDQAIKKIAGNVVDSQSLGETVVQVEALSTYGQLGYLAFFLSLIGLAVLLILGVSAIVFLVFPNRERELLLKLAEIRLQDLDESDRAR